MTISYTDEIFSHSAMSFIIQRNTSYDLYQKKILFTLPLNPFLALKMPRRKPKGKSTGASADESPQQSPRKPYNMEPDSSEEWLGRALAENMNKTMFCYMVVSPGGGNTVAWKIGGFNTTTSTNSAQDTILNRRQNYYIYNPQAATTFCVFAFREVGDW